MIVLDQATIPLPVTCKVLLTFMMRSDPLRAEALLDRFVGLLHFERPALTH
jgi:hypothetical protein